MNTRPTLVSDVLSRKLWGGDYMTEAANAVVEWAINLSFVYRIWGV